jgi:peptide/nickel transport system substrate-binding protein
MKNMSNQNPAYAQFLNRTSLDRRALIHLSVATGLTVTIGATMFPRPSAAAPKKGGHLKLGLSKGSTTDSLDPATYLDYYMATVGWGCLGNGLTQVDEKGAIQPDLAESFEPSSDAKTWAFKLRKGLSFHNGKTVAAADVIASVRHHMGENSKSAAKSLVAAIKEIKADGESIVFALKEGDADFPYLLSDYHLPIMPGKGDGSVDWASGSRTGPYMLEKFTPGVNSTMKRNPNYHRDCWFETVEVLPVIDAVARTNAILNNDVEYIDSCDPKTIKLLQNNPDLEVDEVVGQAHNVFSMNITVPPFDNPKVRNALKYAVDRDAILRKVFYGLGVLGNDNPMAPTMKFAVDPQPRHSYDPDMAKSFLQKAGLTNLKVDLSASDAAFNGAVDAALLFQDSAAKSGITINVIREANDGYWEKIWMKKPFVASQWYGRPTADWLFALAYAENSTWNETAWKNRRFNELLAQARSELDESQRARMYAECQQLVHDDGGLINLMFVKFASAHRKSVTHGRLLSNWDIDGLRIAERWWQA